MNLNNILNSFDNLINYNQFNQYNINNTYYDNDNINNNEDLEDTDEHIYFYILNRDLNRRINEMINSNIYPNELLYLSNNNFLDHKNDNIIKLLDDIIVPYLLRFNYTTTIYYRKMIYKLYNYGFNNLSELYYNIGLYILINSYEYIENHMNIVREEIIFQHILIYNTIDIINTTREFEDVKLIIPEKDLNNIPLIKYLETDKTEIKCTICQFEFNDNDVVRKVKCNHLYHKECIDKWLSEESYKCPNCKSQVAEYIPKI